MLILVPVISFTIDHNYWSSSCLVCQTCSSIPVLLYLMIVRSYLLMYLATDYSLLLILCNTTQLKDIAPLLWHYIARLWLTSFLSHAD